MGRTDQVTSAPPPGAGRIRDLSWPDFTTAGTAPGALNSLRCRITGANIPGTLNNFTALTADWQFFQGADVVQLVSSAGSGTGGSYSFLNTCNVNIRTTALPYWPTDDDWNVHRIMFVACVNGTVTTDDDAGVELLNAGAGAAAGILRAALPSNGFGLRFGTGGTHGTMQFVTRNNASGVVNSVLATDGVGGFDITKLHAYEMRIFSALANQPPFVKLLVDSVLVATIPFSNARMPQNGESGAAGCGFFPTVIMNTANTAGMFVRFCGFQAAPTELFTF